MSAGCIPTPTKWGAGWFSMSCGNRYRLIVGVKYADEVQHGTVWVKHFLTHAEYSKGHWKRDC